jgi:DDE family transposase
VGGYPQKDRQQDPVVRIGFDTETCLQCPTRLTGSQAKKVGRTLVWRAAGRHPTLPIARDRQKTSDFKTVYRKRSGIEGTLSQPRRSNGMRSSRYVGFAKMHLQNLASAVATNIKRIVDWLNKVPISETRHSRFTLLLKPA